jgi:queuine/archaeosine tRNA-ribosyltransferase
VLSYVPVQLAFCYDNLEPPGTIAEIVDEIERSALKDQKASDLEALLPIAHCQNPAMFPEVCAQVAAKLHPLMIGVPERELGVGIVERINCVAAIRDAMNSNGEYCPLHVLGTGNPRSLILLSIAGADSFDGLEWCQTCVDYDTHTLHHLSHMDLYWHQSAMGNIGEIAPAARALTHNIFYYEDFMRRVRDSVHRGTAVQLAREVCGTETFERVVNMSEGLRRSVTGAGGST